MTVTLNKKTEDFLNKLNEVYPKEFKVTGEYKNNRTKVMVVHLECNNEFEVHPYDFLNKRQSRCKFCHQKERMLKNVEEYLESKNMSKEYSYDLSGIEFQYEKAEFKHEKCGYVFKKAVDTFLQGQHCPACSGGRTYKGSVQLSIDEITSKGEFTILNPEEEVNKYNVDVTLLHSKCNKEMKVNLNYFLFQSHKCKNCENNIKSFPEEKIKNFLEECGVKFKREYTFEDCKNSNVLRFDFAVLNENGKPLFLIEYDGECHFGSWQYGEENYKTTREKDLIKNSYCKNNDITLYRIPYTKYRFINSIIFNILKQNNLPTGKRNYKLEKYKNIEEYTNYYNLKYRN